MNIPGHYMQLSYGQPLVPVILTLVHEELEELLNLLVNPLGLTIHLWVVSGGGCYSDPQKLIQGACKA